MGENLHKLSSLKRLQNILIWSEKIISSIYQNTNLLFPDHTLLWWSDRKKICTFGNYFIFYITKSFPFCSFSTTERMMGPTKPCSEVRWLGKKLIVSFFSYQTIETYIPMYLKGNNITPNLFWVGNGLTSSHSTLYSLHPSESKENMMEGAKFFSTFFIYFFLVSFLLIDINYSGISSANFFLEKCKWVIHICLN